MGKILTWGGLIIAAVFFIIGFLAGATNGPDMTPIWPAVYGSNQTLWAGLMVLGLILFVIGLVMVIVRAMKNRKQA
ncbi:MAG: hypothetical protein PHQ47_02400 [Candidatus Portnoybacteria bacterium]|nr:hypothetical protein [Candidatus Portnoybacteria bacterium]